MEKIVALGGVCRTKDLKAAGLGQSYIRRAVASGELRRLRKGWYALPWADDKVERAVRAGGVLGCASALALRGAWDVAGAEIHVRATHHHTGRLATGMRRCHAFDDVDDGAPVLAVDEFPVALRAALRCLAMEDFVAICDSLVHRSLLELEDIALTLGSGRRAQAALDLCGVAESGSESLVRLRLRALGVALRSQVWIEGVGRVDLLVGERLVIEVDSRAHHTGEANYASDRARDLRLRAMGYIVIRLTYHQVVYDWPATEQSLLAMLRRGDQWWRSRGGRRAA